MILYLSGIYYKLYKPKFRETVQSRIGEWLFMNEYKFVLFFGQIYAALVH